MNWNVNMMSVAIVSLFFGCSVGNIVDSFNVLIRSTIYISRHSSILHISHNFYLCIGYKTF